MTWTVELIAKVARSRDELPAITPYQFQKPHPAPISPENGPPVGLRLRSDHRT